MTPFPKVKLPSFPRPRSLRKGHSTGASSSYIDVDQFVGTCSDDVEDGATKSPKSETASLGGDLSVVVDSLERYDVVAASRDDVAPTASLEEVEEEQRDDAPDDHVYALPSESIESKPSITKSVSVSVVASESEEMVEMEHVVEEEPVPMEMSVEWHGSDISEEAILRGKKLGLGGKKNNAENKENSEVAGEEIPTSPLEQEKILQEKTSDGNSRPSDKKESGSRAIGKETSKTKKLNGRPPKKTGNDKKSTSYGMNNRSKAFGGSEAGNKAISRASSKRSSLGDVTTSKAIPNTIANHPVLVSGPSDVTHGCSMEEDDTKKKSSGITRPGIYDKRTISTCSVTRDQTKRASAPTSFLAGAATTAAFAVALDEDDDETSADDKNNVAAVGLGGDRGGVNPNYVSEENEATHDEPEIHWGGANVNEGSPAEPFVPELNNALAPSSSFSSNASKATTSTPTVTAKPAQNDPEYDLTLQLIMPFLPNYGQPPAQQYSYNVVHSSQSNPYHIYECQQMAVQNSSQPMMNYFR